MKAVILDTETTGNEPPEVIELAWAPFPYTSADDIQIQRFKPSKSISYGALAVHHILDEELEWAEASATARIPEGTDYIIGHNIDYDWKALGSPEVKRICTLAIAQHLYSALDSHKLGALMYAFSSDRLLTRSKLRDAHSAAADVVFCHEILHKMIPQGLPTGSVEELWAFSEKARIPSIMAFGKHKGMAIKDLPYDYKKWMLKQVDMDPYVLQAVRGTL